MSYFYRNRSQTKQTQKNKKDNKHPIGKQHADNQSEVDTRHIGEREKKVKKQEVKKEYIK